jgi:hypothetical protein
MKTYRPCILLFLSFLAAPGLFPIESLKNLFKPGDTLIGSLPAIQAMDIQEIQIRDGKNETKFNKYVYSVDKADNTFSIVTSDGSFRGTWNAQFLIVKKRRVVKDRELAREWNLDEKNYVPDPKSGKIIIEEFREGKKTNTRDMENKFLVLDLDVLTPFLQVMTARNISQFNADSTMDGFVVNLDFIPTRTREPFRLSPDLPVPETAKKLEALGEEVCVWCFGATGIVSVVYPDKYYIAFRSSPPFAFVASWGGKKDKAYYTVCPANIP